MLKPRLRTANCIGPQYPYVLPTWLCAKKNYSLKTALHIFYDRHIFLPFQGRLLHSAPISIAFCFIIQLWCHIYCKTVITRVREKENLRKGKNGEIQKPGPIHSYTPSVWTKKKDKELVGRNFLTDQCYEHENRKCCIFTMEWKIVFKNVTGNGVISSLFSYRSICGNLKLSILLL